MRTTAALRSRKLPVHFAEDPRAKSKSAWRATSRRESQRVTFEDEIFTRPAFITGRHDEETSETFASDVGFANRWRRGAESTLLDRLFRAPRTEKHPARKLYG